MAKQHQTERVFFCPLLLMLPYIPLFFFFFSISLMEKSFLWDYSLFPLYFLCLFKSTFLSNKFSLKALSISYSFWHLCNKYDVVVKTALSLVQMLVLPFTSYVDLGIFIIHKSVSPFLKIGEIMTLICYIYIHISNNWASLVAQLVKNPLAMRETWVWSLGWEDPLEKGKAAHSSFLA